MNQGDLKPTTPEEEAGLLLGLEALGFRGCRALGYLSVLGYFRLLRTLGV